MHSWCCSRITVCLLIVDNCYRRLHIPDNYLRQNGKEATTASKNYTGSQFYNLKKQLKVVAISILANHY